MKRYLGKRKILRIYINNTDKFENTPLWQEIIKRAKEYGLNGATVFKAVAGMGAHTTIHSFNVWSLSQELPVVIEIIDKEENIRNFIEEINDIIDEGLVTVTDTEVIKYKHKLNENNS